MIRFLIISIMFLLNTLTVSSLCFARIGQHGDFDQVIVLTADGTLPSPNPFSLMIPDPNATCLKTALNWNDRQIKEFQLEAEVFFRDRFGIDFTNVTANADGIKVLPGVGMFLFVHFSADAGYKAIYMDGHGTNRLVDTMGYIAVITSRDVKYHGEFGGIEGSPAFPGEILAYGIYNIKRGESSEDEERESDKGSKDDIVFFQQSTPGRSSPEGLIGIFCDILNEKWGVGKGEGATAVTPLRNGQGHVFIRNILAFPGRRSQVGVE